MLNQVVLVGRLAHELEIKELEEGEKVVNITLAVPRPFKNAEGVYETDFIPMVLFNEIAKNTAEYCNKGDLVGIKGRIQTEEKEMKIIVEKLTFLSSHKKSDEE